MPFRSEAQKRAMYAAASGHSTLGIPKAAAQSFIAHSDDTKKKLPKHVKHLVGKRKRG